MAFSHPRRVAASIWRARGLAAELDQIVKIYLVFLARGGPHPAHFVTKNFGGRIRFTTFGDALRDGDRLGSRQPGLGTVSPSPLDAAAERVTTC